MAAVALAVVAGPYDFQRLYGLVMASLVALGVAHFAIRRLLGPLAGIKRATAAGWGERLEPIPIHPSHDEIELLARAFNSGIAELSASRDEVRRQASRFEDRIRRRTEELDGAVKLATAASQAKSEFLANVSHELRTPMNGVIGMIEVALDSRLNAEQREQLETALRCAYSLLALVNDILDVSKIEAGRMVLEKIPFDVRRLVADCVEAHRGAASAKGIAIGWTADPAVPAQVTGDPLRIRQMISSLLGNGVKFTDSGEVQLNVSANGTSGQAVELRFSVRDTGLGIPAEKLPVLFQPFAQADSGISRRHSGTGLGLAITRRLAEMHGGTVTVASTLGAGSTFTLSLVCENPTPAEPSSSINAWVETREQNRARVLVAEDNAINQKVVTAILRKKGFEPIVANDGREALELLRAAPSPDYFSIVLMDVQMPGMDGLEATRMIRDDQRWSNLPVVAMTAHAMISDRDRCLQAGMTGYVSKPVNPAHLIATVERYIRQGTRPERGFPDAESSASRRSVTITAGSEASLAEGMVQVFLQLAPDRLSRLSAAAHAGDVTKLVEEAQRIASAAQRIAAAGVSECTREITKAATEGDLGQIEDQLARLSEQIAALDSASAVPASR